MRRAILKLTFIFILLISVFLQIDGLTNGHNWGGDFASYIMQAKSITAATPDDFVKSSRFTVENSPCMIGPIAYPWGFPMILAPVYAVFGLNIYALKAISILFYLLFMFLSWFTFREERTNAWFLVFVSLFAFNPMFISFTNNILSDLPFLLISTTSIFLIRKKVVYRRFSHYLEYLILGILISIAFAIRTNGILLLLTLFISLLIKTSEDKKSIGFSKLKDNKNHINSFISLIKKITIEISPSIITLSIFLCTILIWRHFLPVGGNSHVVYLRGISLSSIIDHLYYYFIIPSKFYTGISFAKIIYWISIPFTIYGLLIRYRKDYPIIIYIILTLALYIVWPPIQGIRFIFPIIPFYISFTLYGLEAVSNYINKKIIKAIMLAPVLLILIRFVIVDINEISNKKYYEEYGPFTRTSGEMFSFITNNTAIDDNIIFFKPRVMKLMTSRQSIMTNRVDDLILGDYLCCYWKEKVACQMPINMVDSLLIRNKLYPVFNNNDFTIYRITNP